MKTKKNKKKRSLKSKISHFYIKRFRWFMKKEKAVKVKLLNNLLHLLIQKSIIFSINQRSYMNPKKKNFKNKIRNFNNRRSC